MSASTHTPGPVGNGWCICPVGDGIGPRGGIGVEANDPADGNLFLVCEVWGIDTDVSHDARSMANARLIAAAPDLLAALTDLATVAAHFMTDDVQRATLAAARAAIAKAVQP